MFNKFNIFSLITIFSTDNLDCDQALDRDGNMIMDETIPDKVVSEIMGTSVKTLLYHYSHVRNGIQGDTLADYAESIL